MTEREFADSYEFDMKKIYEMLFFHMRENENFEYFCKEDDERINALTKRLDNIMALDEEFKKEFVSDLNNTMCYASSNSFENGLKIGLSLLKSLLTAEMPEIHVIHHLPHKTERRYIPAQQPSELDPTFIDYIKKVLPYLKDDQKMRLQGRMEAMIEKNIKEHLDIF